MPIKQNRAIDSAMLIRRMMNNNYEQIKWLSIQDYFMLKQGFEYKN